MTAWPLNCPAASAAEDVLWRHSADAPHRLLIDTPAVPVRFDTGTGTDDKPAPTAAAIERQAATELVRRTAQMLKRRELKPR